MRVKTGVGLRGLINMKNSRPLPLGSTIQFPNRCRVAGGTLGMVHPLHVNAVHLTIVLRHQWRTSAAFPAREKLYSTYEKYIFGVENAVEKSWCIARYTAALNTSARTDKHCVTALFLFLYSIAPLRRSAPRGARAQSPWRFKLACLRISFLGIPSGPLKLVVVV